MTDTLSFSNVAVFQQFIDSGGAYRYRNPVFGESLAPNISSDLGRQKLGIKRKLLKDTYQVLTRGLTKNQNHPIFY